MDTKRIPLESVLTNKDYVGSKYDMPVILGYDEKDELVIDDLARMPHLLIGGCTGSGKSIFLLNIMTCLTSRISPKELQLILIDLKMTEFACYANEHPHLVGNVITNVDKAVAVLRELVAIMEDRKKAMSSVGALKFDAYNRKADVKLPRIVVMIDELAELMMSSEEAGELIALLTAQAHGVGIHFIAASQRAASTDIIYGALKANFQARAVFKMFDEVDSVSLIGEPGAEQLSHFGDMIYRFSRLQGVRRIRVPFITEEKSLSLANRG